MNHTEGVTVKEAKKTLPDGWRWVRLGEACEINPRRSASLQRADNAPTTFVPMSAVDERSASIVRAEVRPFADVQKGYTYFEEGDVLFAKITPCMQNGKHAIARDLIGGVGFGTTEFHVLRPSPTITSEWIHCFLRQPTVLGAATAYFTGAVGQQRVPDSYLARLEIPLPPPPEQKRIAAILNEQMAVVERARAAAEAQWVAAKTLPAAYLRAVFNSPEAQEWPRKSLGEVFRVKSGEFLPAKAMNQKGRYPVYGGNGINGYHDTFMFEEPKIVIGRVGALCGCIHITQPNSWVTDNALYVSEKVVSFDDNFMAYYLRFLDLNRQANTMAQPLVTGQLIYPLQIALPSFDEQQRITLMLSEQMAVAERTRKALEEQLDTINKLPAALLRRAFSGEL